MKLMDAARMIREARQLAGLSQSQLAALAGTSQPTVARYESGRATLLVTTLDTLLEACTRRSAKRVPAVHEERTPLPWETPAAPELEDLAVQRTVTSRQQASGRVPHSSAAWGPARSALIANSS